MQYNKLLLALSTTFIILTSQSCSYNNQAVNQKQLTSGQDTLGIAVEEFLEKSPDYLAEFDLSKSEELTNKARLLAGMNIKQKSKLTQWKHDRNWLEHHRFFAHSWSKLETQQLTKVRQWSQEKLVEINNSSPSIFYPFSGADFLYAYSLFPQAKEFILIDSEPIGTVSDLDNLSSLEIKEELQEVRNALFSLLESSFLGGDDNKIYDRKQGVLPILYVFLARTNHRILNVEYISIDREANIQTIREDFIPGVKIDFVAEDEIKPRTLYYFFADLSNQGIQEYPEIGKFISKLDKPVTYLNTASYLMYYNDFTEIKDLTLANSNYLLQDDSGMPLRFFNKQKWDLTFYGKYTSPIALFRNHDQPDLRRVYNLNKGIEPLNFGIGYKVGINESNLMLAKTKK